MRCVALIRRSRKIATLAAVLAAIVLLAPPSVLAADLDQFWSKVKKSAPDDVDLTPPVVCVCKDGSAERNNRAGQLYSNLTGPIGSRSVVVSCLIPLFNGTSGSLYAVDFCVTWDLVPK
jgi:hypothetical protein